MLKFFRSFLAVTVLMGIGLSQLPAPAQCRMSSGIVKMSCPMPCCKTPRMPLNCPMLKAEMPQDRIASKAPSLQTVLVVLHEAVVSLGTMAPRPSTWLTFLPEICRSLFLSPPLLGRSPPSDILTLNA